MKDGFYCELKPTMMTNNIPVAVKQECSFFFEFVGDYEYKVYGYSALGVLKQGEAQICEGEGGDVIQGEFIENGTEIDFDVSPINTFGNDLFFGTGEWVEKNSNGSVRQKYTVKFWDARVSEIEGTFLTRMFGQAKELKSEISKLSSEVDKGREGLSALTKHVNIAQNAVDHINANNESISENLTKAKAMLERSDELKESLSESKERLSKLIDSCSKLEDDNKEVFDNLKKVEGEADAVKAKADNALGSAVTVALAKAFKDRKAEAVAMRNKYDRVFYIALAAAVVVAGAIVFSYSGNGDGAASSYLEHSLLRLPFLGMPIWLGVFASKKSSLATRLEEFYAQKQALAESYEGYRSEVSSVNGDASSELVELIKINLISINKDSSSVLDGAYKETHTPFGETLNVVSGVFEKKSRRESTTEAE